MSQPIGALEARIRPGSCDGEPAFDAHILVVVVVNHQCFGGHGRHGTRHFEFLPVHTDFLLQPPLHGRADAFWQAKHARKKSRITNQRRGRCDLYNANVLQFTQFSAQCDADASAAQRMTDKTRDHHTFRLHRASHRGDAFGKIGDRRLAAFAHAVADVIKQPDLISTIKKWLDKFPKLRTATAPAVAHDDGRSPSVTELPCSEFANRSGDRNASAILQVA